MLEKVVLRKFYLERHLQSPLLREREDYVRFYYERGRGRGYLLNIADYMLRIVELLHLSDADNTMISINDISEAAAKWAKMETNHPQKRSYSSTGKENFITIATDWLKRINRLAPLVEDSVPIFNELFDRIHARRKMVTAPLLKERVEYLQYWKERGATRYTLRVSAVYELHVIKYLSFHQLRNITFAEIRQASQDWAKEEKITGRTVSYSKYAEKRFVRFANGWLRYMNCLNEEKSKYPFEDNVVEYLDYLTDGRGYSGQTAATRYSVLKNVFQLLGRHCGDLSQVTPVDIDNVITSIHEVGKMSRKSVSGMTSVLRSFFQYERLCLSPINAAKVLFLRQQRISLRFNRSLYAYRT